MAFRSSALTEQTKFNIKALNQKVNKARREKKIFLVLGGYEKLRKSLIERGWIERIPDNQLLLVPPNSDRFKLALLLKKFPCYFFWQPRYHKVDNLRSSNPLVSTIARKINSNFTSKEGLNNCARIYHWYHIDGLTDLNYQRSHVLNDNSSKEEFLKDFKRTFFTNFIMFLNDNSNDFESLCTTAESGISMVCVDFAVKKIEILIEREDLGELDTRQSIDVFTKLLKLQNKEMLADIRQIMDGTGRFKIESDFSVNEILSQVHQCAEKITTHWPNVKYDGYHNIWIMKPIGQSSGYGVTVFKSEGKILEESRTISNRFIVQKYIEKPLIIHNRKFDMRIYFITFIRDGFVDVWLYKDCYIKFSTPEFSLDNLDKSIHVTNYAVQKHFMNPLDIVPNAKENMWTLKQLIEHFDSNDRMNVWSDQIYPGIKRNILAVILASLEDTELIVNNFELNGADFMIGFDYEPLLIEINSKPALHFSKTVIEMITDRLLEDVIKVTVDHQRNPSASTGEFELAHSFEIPIVERSFIEGTIVGNRMSIRKPERTSMRRLSSSSDSISIVSY